MCASRAKECWNTCQTLKMCLIPSDFYTTTARTGLLRGMDFSMWPRTWGMQQCSRGLAAASGVRFYLGKLLFTHTRLLSSLLPSVPWAGCSLLAPQRLLQPHCFTLLTSAGAALHFSEWWKHQRFMYWGDRHSMCNHQLSRHKGLRELTVPFRQISYTKIAAPLRVHVYRSFLCQTLPEIHLLSPSPVIFII